VSVAARRRSLALANVNPSDPPAARKAAFVALLDSGLQATIPPDAGTTLQNARRFLLHVAWHEGDKLQARVQHAGGPARSFFQYEAMRARDELLFLNTTKLGWLAQVGGITEPVLRTAATALPVAASTFPAGNLVRNQLETNDLFAIILTRLAFLRIIAPLPGTVLEDADYWYAHWKRAGGDPVALKAAFIEHANEVDAL